MRKIFVLVLLSATSMFGNNANSEERFDREGWERIMKLPNSSLQPIARTFTAANCTIWVTETIEPTTPLFGSKKIIYPYKCKRPNHRYHCAKNGVVESEKVVDASYSAQITIDYKVVDGLPKFTKYINTGPSSETKCGDVILEHLRSISLP